MKKTDQKKSPPKRSHGKRNAALVVGLLFLLVSLFPWWSIYLAKPLLSAVDGLQVDSLSQRSWSEWTLRQASFQTTGLSFEAQEISLPSPSYLLLAKIGASDPTGSLELSSWRLALSESEQTSSPSQPLSLPSLLEQVERSTGLVHQYVSAVKATDGLVQQNGKDLLSVELIEAREKRLTVKADYLASDLPFEADVDYSRPSVWRVLAETSLAEADLELRADQGATLEGELTAHGNRIALSANWAPDSTGFIPTQASASSKRFALDQRYAFWKNAQPVTVDAELGWTGQEYRFSIQSVDASVKEQPIDLNLSGFGDFAKLTIESAEISLPWLEAHNDAPLVIDFSLANPLEQAELVARADLAELPWIEADGSVSGRIKADASGEGLPLLTANVDGEAVRIHDTRFSTFTANIKAVGTDVSINSLRASTESGSSIDASGSLDLAERSSSGLSVSLALKNESAMLNKLIGFEDWQELSADLSLSGALANPALQGSLSVSEFVLPELKPLTLNARIDGTLRDLHTEATVNSEANTLDLAFNLKSSSAELVADLKRLRIRPERKNAFATSGPAQVRFDLTSKQLAVKDLSLGDGQGSLIALPNLLLSADQLIVTAHLAELEPSFFESWLRNPKLPNLHITELNTEIALSADASQIQNSGEISWSLDSSNVIEASWRAHQQEEADKPSFRLDHLEIGSQGKHILRSKGDFPVSLGWSDNRIRYRFLKDAPISLTLNSTPHPDFWRSIETLVPVAITRPVINARIDGSLADPEGQLSLRLASLNWKDPSAPEKRITLSNIELEAEANNGILTVTTLSANAGANRLKGRAELPLKDKSLTELLEARQLPTFDTLDGSASLELTDFAAIDVWLPSFMRREGSATIESSFKSGQLEAKATVSKLATRPLPPLGSFSQVSGTLRYQNGRFETSGLEGMAEQSPFKLVGGVQLRKGKTPLYDLSFTSQDFPLLRDSGLMFSGDIDLSLTSKAGSAPQLAGNVKLKKGLVLTEPELLASSTKTNRQRPPYFAVETEPYSAWGLDIGIRGEQFLRVSNSFFEGTLSADFKLDGTLGNPLLVGRAEATSGVVRFPAASLKLQKGEALITRERPNTIQVEASAIGRLFAYDINLSATGSIEDLDIVINTNPALSQVDALLLVTTGAIPNSGGNLAQQSATSLGLFIGKGLFRKLAGPGDSDAASKLSLEVGNDISLQGKKTIEATYQLTDTLEIEGEYDKRDEYNANLKWTFFKK
ncbi:translocation/assembly module TamB domain-containing protein [Pelagicoccus sp. SDUM812003]|uniref:translocation/assembly module TamB domain-containing protein n=1 Tax=Pelagicoccus sp. SDUM812003 TaxID=3041267 RepID=UPI00280FFA13|nr:translocation/assembly module TamB domain-containing protein [Pelagicoccus sp. SDUM812003]MDQ8205212.1 translocation/assembly module TamB domain-containing protein [Pelagicoccus sp. SDUM812003]